MAINGVVLDEASEFCVPAPCRGQGVLVPTPRGTASEFLAAAFRRLPTCWQCPAVDRAHDELDLEVHSWIFRVRRFAVRRSWYRKYAWGTSFFTLDCTGAWLMGF